MFVVKQILRQTFFLTKCVLLLPSEQQRGPVRHQRHWGCHALLRRYIPLCGHCPCPPRGRGWRPQPCSCGREWRKWRERTEQGGGGSSGAGLPHSSGAVCRSPPLDFQLRTDLRKVYRERSENGDFTHCWFIKCLSSADGPHGPDW